MLAAAEDRMSFIDKNARAMRVRDIEHLLQISEVAVHRINALHYHELAPAFLPSQCSVQ